ncbi:hypothetical protein Nepgr_015236 [Nepenthes gracilis]|uniref:Activator of Hsp90 ATPase AHSA1-like N-terminal domain-containing protein n=1 Tax=Nepenthes gracilis TaxID=150966 RepID=A0AAD3XRB1_NEPGR|nr:hypothetical protein Nepgr_015236 [Nepenthes gracilis]
MEGGAVSEKQASSYRYWVREATADATPLPVPKMLSTEDLSNIPSQPSLGSVWNRAGTWEEKNLNTWATDRIKELLSSVGCLGFSNGKAEVTEVSRCTGDAFLVTVRNKKRVGYTFEITIEVKGEWTVGNEKRKIKGHLGIPELSYGELDELQMKVKLEDDKDLPQQYKHCICQDLNLFLQPVREKLLQFEQELRER